jgi:hypothetical protein
MHALVQAVVTASSWATTALVNHRDLAFAGQLAPVFVLDLGVRAYVKVGECGVCVAQKSSLCQAFALCLLLFVVVAHHIVLRCAATGTRAK